MTSVQRRSPGQLRIVYLVAAASALVFVTTALVLRSIGVEEWLLLLVNGLVWPVLVVLRQVVPHWIAGRRENVRGREP
jgi:hypothetical protein